MKKILVVDDEPAVCNMLEKFLTRKGYEAIIALSGEEAIRKVKEGRPHVILLDIKMPGIDGIETLKRIRAIDKEVGIVMITAVKEEETGKKCLELGAYDYITKPLSLDYLETVLMVKLLDFS
jgi:DNA-binding response OmpR family regulator